MNIVHKKNMNSNNLLSNNRVKAIQKILGQKTLEIIRYKNSFPSINMEKLFTQMQINKY